MKILKTISFLCFLSLFQILSAQSQDSDTLAKGSNKETIRHPNIIKINSLALLFRNASIVYERGIIPRLSVALGLGYKFSGKEPSLFSVNESEIEANLQKISGFTITPEARYYLRSCDHGKLEGFYAGIYLRYTNYRSGANFTYNPQNQPSESYGADLILREYGVGIQLGYQIIIKERFSIDFLFIGPRISSYKLGYEFNQQPSQAFLNDLSGYINDVVDRFGFDYSVNIEQQGEAKASTSFSFANTRFGISLGFAF